MRAIGEIQDTAKAEQFNDILCAQGIASELDRSESNGWTIWVKADEDCPRAAELLRVFVENPADARFRTAREQADALRRETKEDQARYERRVQQTRKSFASLKGYTFGPLTFVLIFISGAIFVATNFGANIESVKDLLFSAHRAHGPMWTRLFGVPELQQGQLWRLVTPIFIHMTVLHFFFNAMWMADLGSMIESRQSTWLMARLVVGLAIGSNIAQYVISGRPNFGGLSGVVYGLIGYMWIRGKFDPTCGLRLHYQTVLMAMIWFFFCFTGYAGPIANAAHTAGLVIGMAWGWMAARYRS
jgi:GlpG protein